MKAENRKLIWISLLLLTVIQSVQAQQLPWTLNDCISYALNNNLQVQQANLESSKQQLYNEQAQAAKLPSLSGSVRKIFNWNKTFDSQTDSYGSLNGSNSTSYSLSSSVTLFNGMKLTNQAKQAALELESSTFYTNMVKESLELNILDAYLQLLFAAENVSNAEKQLEVTTEQLALAQERFNLSVISQSDFLQIKSELASEKLTLANAKNQQSLARITLMQLIELPADSTFEIAAVDLNQFLNKNILPKSGEIFQQAIGIKPQIKKAELDSESAQLNEKIAKASLLPNLSLDAGLGTNYLSSTKSFNYGEQLGNQISPNIGLSLNIPIFQKKQAKTSISLAQISTKNAEIEEKNTKNQLRKEIEQATNNVVAAQREYEASLEGYQSLTESNKVANEKYEVGLINSVDYLFEKTNLITAESKLLQSKYKLVFYYKILDFYTGTPLTL